MCDFHDLLDRYANTIPSNHLLFRVSKPCGYSQLVVIPRDNNATVNDLCEGIRKEMGEYTTGRVIFYKKHEHQIAIDFERDWWYLHIFRDDALAKLAVERIPLAYSIEDCRYAVYQLYLDMEGLSCEQPHHHCETHTTPVTESEPTSTTTQYEPTREELLSLIYNPVAETKMDIESPPPNEVDVDIDNNTNINANPTTDTTPQNKLDYII
jgi:hypothetical protein